MLEIVVEDLSRYTSVRLLGEFNADILGAFRETISELDNRPQVVIDLTDVTFMDSAGLGGLIGGTHRIKEKGASVTVVSGTPAIRSLLSTSGFDQVVSVMESSEAAEDALSPTTG